MKGKSNHILNLPILILLLLFQLYYVFAFSPDKLPATYSLHSGRLAACPENVSYATLTSDNPLIPAASMKAEDHVCSGKGGKRVVEGSSVLSHGLNLPTFTMNPNVTFYAGVETDTRVCGPWAFNASSISWFILNGSDKDVLDDDTNITLQPGYIYVTYSHFSDVCVYRTKVEIPLNPSPASSLTPEIESTEEPTKAPAARPTEEATIDAPACFPGNTLVTVEGRGLIAIKSLMVGDRVLSSADGAFSEVFAFSHRNSFAQSAFIQIQTSSGKRLKLSAGHLLYLDRVPKMAKEAQIGNSVITASGARENIVSIEQRFDSGLYNPETISGTIVVNGILVTTWTSAVPPVIATSLLSPIRWLYRVAPIEVSSFATDYLDVVIDQFRILLRYT